MSCNGGRREISKPGITGSSKADRDKEEEVWDGEVGETKAEADGDGTGIGPERV